MSDGYGNLSFVCTPEASPCRDCLIASQGNPPCKNSIDLDGDDEFAMAINAINAFIDAVTAWQQAVKTLYERLSALEQSIDPNSPMACGLYGGNPATYRWTDSRGEHAVMIMIDSYKEPRLKKRSYGNWLVGKKCIELDYGQQDVTVKMMRVDPQEEVGILGTWNQKRQIDRTSVARYRAYKSHDDKCHPAGYVRVQSRD